jgi:hypothetical protein
MDCILSRREILIRMCTHYEIESLEIPSTKGPSMLYGYLQT